MDDNNTCEGSGGKTNAGKLSAGKHRDGKMSKGGEGGAGPPIREPNQIEIRVEAHRISMQSAVKKLEAEVTNSQQDLTEVVMAKIMKRMQKVQAEVEHKVLAEVDLSL